MRKNAAKNFDILAISLSILYSYFDNPTKLSSDLCPAKFLDTSTKLLIPCLLQFLIKFMLRPRIWLNSYLIIF